MHPSRPETLVRTTPALAYSCDFYKKFPGTCTIVITWIINVWRFSSNLPDVYLLASWFTLHMFLLYLSSDKDHANNFYSYKVCTLFVDWISCHLVFFFKSTNWCKKEKKRENSKEFFTHGLGKIIRVFNQVLSIMSWATKLKFSLTILQ